MLPVVQQRILQVDLDQCLTTKPARYSSTTICGNPATYRDTAAQCHRQRGRRSTRAPKHTPVGATAIVSQARLPPLARRTARENLHETLQTATMRCRPTNSTSRPEPGSGAGAPLAAGPDQTRAPVSDACWGHTDSRLLSTDRTHISFAERRQTLSRATAEKDARRWPPTARR